MSKETYILCPVCGKHKFPKWEDNGTCICPRCGWGHDTQGEEDPFEATGPNDLSLEHFKLRYAYYIENNPSYHWAQHGYPEIPQIEKCVCPVCGKFEFQPLTWEDIYCGETPSDSYCMSCGWHYSPEQTKSPELTNDVNEMSLKEYRAWYAERIAANPDYSYFEEMTDNYVPMPHKCPVCGKYEFEDESSYDICPFCGWEDDGVQLSDPDFDGGANDLSLKQYRKQYREIIKTNPNYRWDRDYK
jgi:rubrerythrin